MTYNYSDNPVTGFEAPDPAADVLVGYFEDWGHDWL